MNIQEILAMLPHRYPFLMLDRVVELVPGERVHAVKNVTANEPQFQGHNLLTGDVPGGTDNEHWRRLHALTTAARQPWSVRFRRDGTEYRA